MKFDEANPFKQQLSELAYMCKCELKPGYIDGDGKWHDIIWNGEHRETVSKQEKLLCEV